MQYLLIFWRLSDLRLIPVEFPLATPRLSHQAYVPNFIDSRSSLQYYMLLFASEPLAFVFRKWSLARPIWELPLPQPRTRPWCASSLSFVMIITEIRILCACVCVLQWKFFHNIQTLHFKGGDSVRHRAKSLAVYWLALPMLFFHLLIHFTPFVFHMAFICNLFDFRIHLY